MLIKHPNKRNVHTNRDGYDDLIVGGEVQSSTTSVVWVFFGKPGFQGIDTVNLIPTEGFSIKGVISFDSFGATVAGEFDVNRDGMNE